MPQRLYRNVNKKPGKGLEKFLGELELAIMELVWERGPVTVSVILAALNEQKRSLAYTSVMTVMSRLAEKGWLKAEKQGRAYVYRAVHSREEAEAAAVGQVVRALLQDFGDLAVVQFVKELDDLDPNQLARLAKLARGVEENHEEQA